jgi:TRAP-type mannitol/chloroaromatic compound transport system permease small subunit
LTALLKISGLIDALNERVGRSASWLVLFAVVISAGNAIVRKVFNNSSNALLEIQWYLFAALFLLAAGYTMLRQEHVKIDVILGRFARRTQVKIEIFGILVFLFPFVFEVLQLSIPFALNGYHSGEMSSNAGGLIRWPVYAMIPLGFGLLGLQGLSELIKRLAFLSGAGPDPAVKVHVKSPEEELAEFVRAQAEAAAAAAAKKS